MHDFYLGLMAGTSLDGVDCALIDDTGRQLLAHYYLPYPTDLKDNLRDLMADNLNLKNLADADIKVAKIFADAAKTLLKNNDIDPKKVRAVGSHGQTIWHKGGVYSMQIGHGTLLAEHLKMLVVADFRMADVAAGGQGAPLTPFYHRHILAGNDGVVVNLGGIANLTIVKNGQVEACDSGPANTLLDAWIRKCCGQNYDNNGVWARSGTVDEDLLRQLLSNDYFQKPAPKSTGIEDFNLAWVEDYLTADKYDNTAVQRTLTELTAVSISHHIPDKMPIFLCGGGVKNTFLIERLAALNPENTISTTDDLGINPDFVEAAAFAFFAKQTLKKQPSNLPEVSGAKGSRILGAIYGSDYANY